MALALQCVGRKLKRRLHFKLQLLQRTISTLNNQSLRETILTVKMVISIGLVKYYSGNTSAIILINLTHPVAR